MKNYIFLGLAFLLIGSSQLTAQISISCNYREICRWNEYSESFDQCYKYEDNSLFKINESETMFTHVTESMKSAYYIESKTQDDETRVWKLVVQSDVGNDYIYFLDFDHDEIRVAAEDDGEIIMIRFYIKNTWIPD